MTIKENKTLLRFKANNKFYGTEQVYNAVSALAIELLKTMGEIQPKQIENLLLQSSTLKTKKKFVVDNFNTNTKIVNSILTRYFLNPEVYRENNRITIYNVIPNRYYGLTN